MAIIYRPSFAAIAAAAFKLADDKGHYNPPKTIKEYLQHLADEVEEAKHAAEFEPVENFAEELADIILLTCSIAGHCGLDIEKYVLLKHTKNQARPWKHGKEA